MSTATIPKKYALTKVDQDRLGGLLLLNEIVSRGAKYGVMDDNAEVLKSFLLSLVAEKNATIVRGNYVATENGRKVVDQLRQQHTEFQDMFNVFMAVDTSAKAAAADDQFGYQKFYDDAYQDEKVWDAYLDMSRWTDLRVAVAEFKKVDPVKMVFLQFLKKNRFKIGEKGWEVNLALGDIWNELLEVVNSAWHVEDFAYSDGGKQVPGEEVVKVIVEKGSALKLELLKIQAGIDANNKAQAAAAEEQGDEEVTEIVTEYVIDDPILYYDPWFADPYYVSPVWSVPLWAVLVL